MSEPEKRETRRLFIPFFVEKEPSPHPISLISLMFLLGLVDELKTTGCKNLIFMDKKCFFVPMCVRIILFKRATESVSPHRSA